jgi:isoleucyl-tRNA synthetase
VVDILRERGALLAEARLDHSYPHCWRCHQPTIFRATEQWFIGMGKNDLRGQALEAIQSVRWVPAWGQERMAGMVSGRPDWCISRQRWGVPIVVFYCEDCGSRTDGRSWWNVPQHTADIWYDTAKRTARPRTPAGPAAAPVPGRTFWMSFDSDEPPWRVE